MKHDYTPTQRRNGGLKRAMTARRHPAYGIFLPNTDLTDNLFPTCYRHGVEGGRVRAQTAERDGGKFVKANKEQELKP